MPTLPETITTLGLDQAIPEEVNGRRNGVDNSNARDEAYHPCAEAHPADGTPEGVVTRYEAWPSRRYAGTTRDLWIYRPAVLSDSVRIILFNDGAWYLSRNGPVRATRVLDTLHAAREIESTVAVFIMPGVTETVPRLPIESYDARTGQRSLEYDMVSGAYGEFLFDEILPFVEAELGISISADPTQRTVCGISSGGIAAFTAAWHFPDQCRRVLSHCGSFTDIWGGHNYPSLVRRTERLPLRVFLQSGEHDANTPFGDWALANRTMASALEYAGYDYRFEFGTGGHNLHHGGAIFADSLRWLWRDE